jgi:hypothetical protein
MFMKIFSSTNSAFRLQIINGLGCSDETSDLRDFLDVTLEIKESEVFKPEEKRAVLRAVLNSYSGLEVVIAFIESSTQSIMSAFEYVSLEALLIVPVEFIKTQEQADMYKQFLLAQTNLDSAALTRLTQIIDANLGIQKLPENFEIMNIIKKLLGRPIEETTTTEMTTTTAETTTTMTDMTTAATEMTTTTSAITTTRTSTVSITSTSSPSISSSPIPTTLPSTSPNPSSNFTSTTTLGASTVGIQLATLLACLVITMTVTFNL